MHTSLKLAKRCLKSRNVFHKVGILLATALLLTGDILAIDYYVATDGNDSQDGLSWTTAWRTATACPASILILSNGLYALTDQVTVAKALIQGYKPAMNTGVVLDQSWKIVKIQLSR